MRLINAEEFEVISWNAQGQRGDYARGYDDGVQYMAEKIDHAPTIDAIPVEWIKKRADDSGSPFSPYYLILLAWKTWNRGGREGVYI